MTHHIAHYHHPIDKRYSMDYVASDVTEFKDKLDQRDSETTKSVGYSFPDSPAYVLYTHTGASGTMDNIETTEEEITEVLDEMGDEDRHIAIRLMNVYEGVLDEENKEGRGLKIYKELEMENIPDTLNEVNWNTRATEVAGRLMSNFVLKHALPNANHRCSISMLEAYLYFCSLQKGLNFSMPQTHTSNFEWREWVNPYIRKSKRILTIRRNNIRFNALREYGCETVVRKGNIRINLSEWDLDMHYRDAWTHYAQKHEELCIEFANAIAERGGAPELREQDALSQEGFARLLASTDGSQDDEETL